MNSNSNGLISEQEIIHGLNNKRVGDISNHLREILRCLFGPLDDNSYVLCTKVDDANKTDFIIKLDAHERFVSMKQGRAESVHDEEIDSFCKYLKDNGISSKTIETIRLYHFGDGTVDGSGSTRMGYAEVMVWLGERIVDANSELNFSREFVFKTVERCVFLGAKNDNIAADCIYFGDRNYGFVATKKQIYKHLGKRDFAFYDNLHIGPLLLRPHSRYAGRPIVSVRNRRRCVLYWPRLGSDIEFIATRYDYESCHK